MAYHGWALCSAGTCGNGWVGVVEWEEGSGRRSWLDGQGHYTCMGLWRLVCHHLTPSRLAAVARPAELASWMAQEIRRGERRSAPRAPAFGIRARHTERGGGSRRLCPPWGGQINPGTCPPRHRDVGATIAGCMISFTPACPVGSPKGTAPPCPRSRLPCRHRERDASTRRHLGAGACEPAVCEAAKS